MSDAIKNSLGNIFTYIGEDIKKQQTLFKKLVADVDEEHKKDNSLVGIVSQLDTLNEIDLISAKIEINKYLELLFMLGKKLATNMDNLTNTISKLPDRAEFNDVKNSLQNDRLMYLDAFNEIKEGLDNQKKQREETKELEDEKVKLKDELRKKQSEHAFG